MRSHCTWCGKTKHTERACASKAKGEPRKCLRCAAPGHSKHNVYESTPSILPAECTAARKCINCNLTTHSTEGDDCKDPGVLEHVAECEGFEGERPGWSKELDLPKEPNVPDSCGRKPTTVIPDSNQDAARASGTMNPGDAARERSNLPPLNPAPPKVTAAEHKEAFNRAQKLSEQNSKSTIQVLEWIHPEKSTKNPYVRVIRKGKEEKVELKASGGLTRDEELVVSEWWHNNMQDSDLTKVNKRIVDRLQLRNRAATQAAEDQSTNQQLPTAEIPRSSVAREISLDQDVPTPTQNVFPSIEQPQFGRPANTYRDGISVETDYGGSETISTIDDQEFHPSSSAATVPQASSQTSLNADVVRMGLRDRKPRASPAEEPSGGSDNGHGSQNVYGRVGRKRSRQKGKDKNPPLSQ
jgi:hypothetical protein